MIISRQEGFTLIELLAVILVIGVLSSIAVPVYNGQREKAHHASAKSTLKNAFTAAKAYYLENQSYLQPVQTTHLDLRRQEASLSATVGDANALPDPSADPTQIYVVGDTAGGNPEWVTLCNRSKGSFSYCIIHNSNTGQTGFGGARGNMIAAYWAAIAQQGWS